MIRFTMGETLYGYPNANGIRIDGLTSDDNPIAEIHTTDGTEYVIFTGEKFPSIMQAIANHVIHSGNSNRGIIDFEPGPDMLARHESRGFMASASKRNAEDYPSQPGDWHNSPVTHSYK